MAAKSVIESLVQQVSFSVLQGAANAFATNAFETGISTGSRFGWMIDRVEFSIEDAQPSFVVTADANFEAQLIQGDAPTAILSATDDDLICEWTWAMEGTAAAATTILTPTQYTWMAPPNFVVVNPQLHIAVDSTGFSAAETATVRIYYFPVELSELDILRIIALR